MYVYPHNGCLLDAEAECDGGDFAAHALGHLDSDFVHNVGALRPLGYAIHPVAALNEGRVQSFKKARGACRYASQTESKSFNLQQEHCRGVGCPVSVLAVAVRVYREAWTKTPFV